MNLFFLDLIPAICALYHCDKHVVKMILENAEVLSCAHWLTGGTEAPYKLMKGYKRYPCVGWLLESLENYRWCVQLGLALCAEYTHRYGKVHSAQVKIEWLRDHEPSSLPNIPMTVLTPAVPEECIRYKADGTKDPIESYKAYYIFVKRYFAKWTKRTAPSWFTDGVNNMSADEREKSEKKIEEVRAGMKKKNANIKASKAKKLEKQKKEEEEKKKADKRKLDNDDEEEEEEEEEEEKEDKKTKAKGKGKGKKAANTKKVKTTTTTTTTTTSKYFKH